MATQFDPARFEEVVLYIAERTKDDDDFGHTKMAKVLFYSDFEAFRELGESITGAEYQAWEHGPYPPKLQSAKNMLKNSGRVTVVETQAAFDTERVLPTGQRPSNLPDHGVDESQRAKLDKWISNLQRATAREIERLSHGHPGYKLVEHNDTIPEAAAFLPTSGPSKARAERAKRIAREQGWLTDEGWIWEREGA